MIEKMGEREDEKNESVKKRRAMGQPGGAECPWAMGENGEERRSKRGG